MGKTRLEHKDSVFVPGHSLLGTRGHLLGLLNGALLRSRLLLRSYGVSLAVLDSPGPDMAAAVFGARFLRQLRSQLRSLLTVKKLIKGVDVLLRHRRRFDEWG